MARWRSQDLGSIAPKEVPSNDGRAVSIFTSGTELGVARVSVAAGSGARRWDVGDAVQVGVDPAWVLQYPVA